MTRTIQRFSRVGQSALQFFDEVLDSDMLSKIATIGIMVLVDTPMRAEAIEHLDNLGSLPFGQQIDLQIEVISMICYNAHSVLLYQHEGRQQDRFQ